LRPVEIAELYRSYGHVVLRRASAILKSRADAEEITQDLFASLLTKDLVPERAAMTTYLYAATTNRALNHLRDEKNRQRLLAASPPPTATALPTGPTRALALQALAKLPEELAEVAVYAFVDEMTHQEISELLGCSRRHVGDLLQRALELVGAEEKVS
jgi:RNA polymerase sigma factor (sigma-70 family)